jgi:aminopeptidase N
MLITHQEQDTLYAPLYRLNIPVEIKSSGKINREMVRIGKVHDTLVIKMEGKPELVLWDADASFLGRLEEERSPESWIQQYQSSTRGIHRLQALDEIKNGNRLGDLQALATVKSALKDKFWACRETALEVLEDLDSLRKQELQFEILNLAQSDPNPRIRKQALKFLAAVRIEQRQSVLQRALEDSSLMVSTEALRQFLAQEYPNTEEVRKKFESHPENNYRGVLATFYEAKGGQDSFDWFIRSMEASTGSESYEIIRSFGEFLLKESDKNRLQQGVDFLQKLGIEGTRPEQVIAVYQVLRKMIFIPDYREKLKAIREKHRNDDFYEILEYLD